MNCYCGHEYVTSNGRGKVDKGYRMVLTADETLSRDGYQIQ